MAKPPPRRIGPPIRIIKPTPSRTPPPVPVTPKKKPPVTGRALAVTRGKGKKKGLKKRGY